MKFSSNKILAMFLVELNVLVDLLSYLVPLDHIFARMLFTRFLLLMPWEIFAYCLLRVRTQAQFFNLCRKIRDENCIFSTTFHIEKFNPNHSNCQIIV